MAVVTVQNTRTECMFLGSLRNELKSYLCEVLSLQEEKVKVHTPQQPVPETKDISITVSELEQNATYTAEQLQQVASQLGTIAGKTFPERTIECFVYFPGRSLACEYWSSGDKKG